MNRPLFLKADRIYYLFIQLILPIVCLSSSYAQLSFTNEAVSKNLHIGAVAKDGGFTWADFNNDGFKDLLINTNSNSSYSRLLYNDGAPGFTYTDVTLSKAPALLSNITERSAIAGDIDNDGDIDFARNTASLVEVYTNNGAPNFAFTLSQSFDAAYFTGAGTQTGINSEGMGLIDFDGDGDLDLFIEDHQYGVDLMINNGSGVFSHYTTDASPRGFGTTGTSGDYSLVGDLNNDGYVDILARRQGTANNNTQADIFINNGNGTFSANYTANLDARNTNKGGVAIGDFDRDGDLDYFWTDNGSSGSGNNCFLAEQTGTNSGVFVLASVTVTGSSTSLPSAGLIDGVTMGDLNHDGRQDIFLTANSGPSILLINTSTGAGSFSFDHNNYGINVNANGEGCEFVDFDNDGDLDLYINIDGGNNQLWVNGLNDTRYVDVVPVVDLGGGLIRSAIGATVIIKDCSGNRISPIMEVNGGSGHGTQASTTLHFGLPAGALTVYYAEVSFVRPNGGIRTVVTKQIFLGLLPNQKITIANTEPSDPLSCFVLSTPGLVDFTAKYNDNKTILSWSVQDNAPFDSYEIEYLHQADNVISLAAIKNNNTNNYTFTHNTNDKGILYYRLKQKHTDKRISYSKIVTVNTGSNSALIQKAFPNPFTNNISVAVNLEKAETITIQIIDVSGNLLKTEVWKGIQGNNLVFVNGLHDLTKGHYILKIIAGNKIITEQAVK